MEFRPNILRIDRSNDPESFSQKECSFVEILNFQKLVACHRHRTKIQYLDKGTFFFG